MRRFGLVMLGVLACANRPADVRPMSGLLDRHDFESPTRRFEMPGRLDEISGLAFTPDGRLFAHDDERGRLHEIDPQSGDVGKRFDLGDGSVRGDFEGLAIAGSRFFLITSTGLLYEFQEADDEAGTPFRATDTGLRSSCEVEGLDYDPAEDVLLIACKVSTPDRNEILVHRLPLDPDRERPTPVRIPRSQLKAHGLASDFAPSAVAVDPTGTLVLVSGREETLIEVGRDGTVLAGVELSRRRHPQSEGLAFGPDGTLYIADERNGRDARVTAYARRVSPGGRP